jgi:ketosteroid isomerase-like protein
MRHIGVVLTLVGSACSAPQRVPSAASAPPTTQTAAAIRVAREAWNQAFAARDTATLAAQWTPNGILSTGLGTMQGRDVILREHYVSLFHDRPDVTFTRTPREIDGHAAWPIVYEFGDWVETWREPDGRTELRGTYYSMWLNTGDRWLLLSDSYLPRTCTGSRYCDPRPRR